MQLHQIMKPKLMLVAAGLSLLLAYPVTQLNHHKDTVSIKRVNHSTIIKVVLPPPPQPIPTPPPAPTAIATSYSCHNYENIFAQYDWNVQTIMAICQAESGGNPNPPANGAINYDGVSDFGIMQLHGVAILDPAQNIAYAYYHKYLTQGFRAWSTYSSGRYIKFL